MKRRRLVIFVEGKGDVAAVPALAKRVLGEQGGHEVLLLEPHPFRVKSLSVLVKEQCKSWHRWLSAAAKTHPDLGAVLLVLDGDMKHVPTNWETYGKVAKSRDFCPCHAARALALDAQIVRAGTQFSVAVVFAMREFEAWLVAGVESVRGLHLPEERAIVPSTAAAPQIDIESRRDAKGMLTEQIPAYQQTLDQGALARHVDLGMVRSRCRSFRRFESAIRRLVDAARSGNCIVDPAR